MVQWGIVIIVHCLRHNVILIESSKYAFVCVWYKVSSSHIYYILLKFFIFDFALLFFSLEITEAA